MNKTKISLHITVGSMFVIATILTALIAVSLQYHFSKKMVTEQTLSKLTMVSEQLNKYIGKVDADAVNTVQLLSTINESVDHVLSEQETRAILSEAIKDNPLFYSIYIGSSNNDFFQIINLDSAQEIRTNLDAKATDRWVVTKISGDGDKRNRITSYFDEAFNLRTETVTGSNYYPTTRPWYVDASFDAVGKTNPYLFQHLQITGQTYSLAFQSKKKHVHQHVIGLDITLSSLSEQISASSLGLASDSNVEAFIFSKSGQIIASNRVRESKGSFLSSASVTITDQQQTFIESINPILISNQNDWGPMDYSVAGKPQGYVIDLLSIISKTTGIQFDYVNGFSWNELVDQFDRGDLHALHSLQNPKGNLIDRMGGLYTDPIYSLPFSVVTRSTAPPVTRYQQLAGKKVAILGGWSIIPSLKKDFPNVELVEFPSLQTAFDSVNKGESYAVLDSKAVLSFVLDRLFHSDLIVNETLAELDEQYSSEFHIALRPEFAQIVPIINLAIANITQQQRDDLDRKWFNNQNKKSDNTIPYNQIYDMVQASELNRDIRHVFLGGEMKHVYLKQIDTGSNYSEFFAVIMPESEIYDSVHSRVITSTLITLALMCLILPLAWIFGAPIVNPIRKLRIQTQKVQRREYDEVELIETRIKEVWELSQAIKEMACDLKRHEKIQEEFVESFIKLIAQAIDDKSPYTGGHCHRVPELGMMLAEAAEKSDLPAFKAFRFKNSDEKREFRIAAWLHDCGKITTPEHIVDKGTKLEVNYNRIHEVRTRFEVLWRDAEITALHQVVDGKITKAEALAQIESARIILQQDFEFIANANVGGEFMSDDKVKRIKEIAKTPWMRHFDDRLGLSPIEELNRNPNSSPLPAQENLLSDKPEHIITRDRPIEFDPSHGINMTVPVHLYNLGEVYNLSIARGTLTSEDRFKINEHMIGTIKMLESLPFPKELSRVPRYASTHHETMKGTGYPRQLTGDKLSIPERILVVSDIFEALTASDRPYKKAKPVSVAIDIMHKMALDEHIDMETFLLFLSSKTYMKYAQEYLKPEQLDEVDHSKYLIS
ncbi:HD domain-containing phosphohydrolase [Vibrio tapetis subsp. quintayensis]|uniref:HD domain-containing phosphohydrolase n=1 Tax=Vibrio tapetis TaxID=52443 RepID=UPI0025B4C4DB|nr:HD domain-containing phosphohydrolase [Vibrio tapetis]MDN3680628.1 HD domain-containing phosphohydrolase [Vibrio tapetis subsp. quintayensis]